MITQAAILKNPQNLLLQRFFQHQDPFFSQPDKIVKYCAENSVHTRRFPVWQEAKLGHCFSATWGNMLLVTFFQQLLYFVLLQIGTVMKGWDRKQEFTMWHIHFYLRQFSMTRSHHHDAFSPRHFLLVTVKMYQQSRRWSPGDDCSL